LVNRDLSIVVALFGPLFAGLVLHGFCIKFGWLRPLDHGALLRGRRLFGDSKTYRGIVAVALGAAVGYAAFPPGALHLSRPGAAIFGFAMGVAAMLSELPNSLLKRQLGIGPGMTAAGPSAVFFYLLDQIDVLLGTWPLLSFWVKPSVPLVLWSAAFVVVIHQAISILGAALGMRTSAR
jgi:CDP-2,3-bis-(O-geranylgeranyl)-sn-glycerol synthase